MKMLECLSCYERFDQETSNAPSSALYCSSGCEADSVAMLAEGNAIVAAFEEQQSAAVVVYHTGVKNIADTLASASIKVKMPAAVTIKPQGNLNEILDGLTRPDSK